MNALQKALLHSVEECLKRHCYAHQIPAAVAEQLCPAAAAEIVAALVRPIDPNALPEPERKTS